MLTTDSYSGGPEITSYFLICYQEMPEYLEADSTTCSFHHAIQWGKKDTKIVSMLVDQAEYGHGAIWYGDTIRS